MFVGIWFYLLWFPIPRSLNTTDQTEDKTFILAQIWLWFFIPGQALPSNSGCSIRSWVWHNIWDALTNLPNLPIRWNHSSTLHVAYSETLRYHAFMRTKTYKKKLFNCNCSKDYKSEKMNWEKNNQTNKNVLSVGFHLFPFFLSFQSAKNQKKYILYIQVTFNCKQKINI